jgi:hypothetical protein
MSYVYLQVISSLLPLQLLVPGLLVWVIAGKTRKDFYVICVKKEH